MPRYVILAHDHPTMHWDLMFEAGEALRTWRLERPPEAGAVVAAEAIADHRLVYLDYEGPVGGERGSVVRWDAGTFDWLEDRPGRVAVILNGIKLKGRLTVTAGGATSIALFVQG